MDLMERRGFHSLNLTPAPAKESAALPLVFMYDLALPTCVALRRNNVDYTSVR
ncbi:unannotated protein [freshwater metagenome]|uniref:Unannotated protein n=1 Tax=freshwater metagenome TaxID=449393 RepID=A0A6J7XT79_9ZZZZ